MYELSRVRLHSVGPNPARYQDITLDLRGVGVPVAKPRTSSTLFGTQDAVPRRPSPASVLFAENGNGKTVLVKLIFSVMLPGRKQIVGTSNTKAMDNFVLADDVSHVALEWMHVETGQLIVTGKTSAWREHRVSVDSSRLMEAWYSFRPTDEFGLDDLPFTHGDRLVEMTGFRDRLAEAEASQPHLQMKWLQSHRDWTERLDDLGLDPALFDYQRRMNAGEGEAADAFSFKSDEAFMDWLLTSVIDKSGPRAMAEVIDSYAVRLAERDAVIAERDFVDGALQRLTPLANAARDYASAVDLQSEAARDATRFAVSLVLRQRREDAALATLLTEKETAAAEQVAADREQRRLVDIARELRRLVAELRLNEAVAHENQVETDRGTARATLTAWQSVDLLLKFQQAHAQAESIRTLISEQEQEAAGPLAARDAAARRLIHGLIVAADTADKTAAEAKKDAALYATAVTEATEEETEHHKAAERYSGEAKATQERINTFNARVDEAVRVGLLTAGVDLPEVAEAATAVHDHARRSVAEADTQAKALVAERKSADQQVRVRIEATARAQQTATDATTRHRQALDATEAIASEPRLGALLGTSELIPETDAPSLIDRLTDAIDEAERERDRLRDADRADRRILDALGSGGLLPPPSQVTLVRDTLTEAGIGCYTGWEYLAQMPEPERETALTLYPHLVGGVVLNNPAHADRARSVLREARLLPSAIVAVGDTTVFADLTGTGPTGLTFLVTPNPALYDEDLAASERDRLIAAQVERTARLETLNAQIEADRTLRTRLTGWRQTYPPGTLAALALDEEEAVSAAGQALEAQAEAQAALDDVMAHEDALAATLPTLREHADKTRQTMEHLSALAVEHQHVQTWTEAVRAARENQGRAERTAREKSLEANQLRQRREEAIRLADDHERTARAHRHEITETFGGGVPPLDQDAPTEPIETLKATYRAARETYEKVQVGADLKAELETRERTEAESHAAVQNLPVSIRNEANNLLASPDGGDEPARAAATSRAQRLVEDLDAALRAASATVGQLRAVYEGIQKQDIGLDPYGRPESIAQGEELVQRAEADRDAAYVRLTDINTRLTKVNATINATGADAQGFSSLVMSLSASVPPDDDIDPDTATAYTGTLNQGRTERDSIMTTLRNADEFLSQASTEVTDTSGALFSYAADRRFEPVDSPVRHQILATPVARLFEYGPDWEEALKPRLRSLHEELSQIDRYRNSIVTTLRGHVDTALRTLRAAERVSVLPDTLGDWAGQHFLHIRFADPDPATLNERLGSVVDTITSDTPGSGKRDGVNIVLKGVRAALPKGVKVEMLKPDTTMRTERVRINQVADVFSGGQLLTAAIILYCTMAALRANDRGRVRNNHAGVLFLDNPIGRASAGYLLDLQLGVAQALGVQLVYTTGLFDTNALSVFPLIIRLRNDQDVRSGKKYLTVDDEIRANIAGLGDPDDTGKITAARLFRRPGPSSEPPAA